jgi:L-ascorbate metabolism protein UlaG (beta-lactamase superfamily)
MMAWRSVTLDTLLIPVGGDRGLKPAQTSEVVSLLEPSIVVPMRYKIPGLDVSLGGLDRFLKQMGIGKIELQDELEVSRTSLPSEIEIVALRPQTV